MSDHDELLEPRPPTFEEFRKAVLETLQSPVFAEPPLSQPGSLSASAKELRHKQAYPLFTEEFFRAPYKLLEEYLSLLGEQKRIRDTRKEYVPKMIIVRNTAKTVAFLKRRVARLAEKTRVIDHEYWQRAIAALSDCEYQLYRYHSSMTSLLHPASRQPPAMSELRWEGVLKSYKYKLPSLKRKAPDQWLYDALNHMLEKNLAKVELSKMTRYRIMASFLKPFGLNVQPITLKLHFESKKAASDSPVKKPRAT
jgi:hypothetical protein